ncbi:MAG TPA: putative metal-dependent hydrolase, partial [Candidatus Elarobacter sp.]|nr:putative metal-dependent hydrolase [Candidatus Elarobacter sp.]
MAQASTDDRYPIGTFVSAGDTSPAGRDAAIADIAALPSRLRAAVAGLSDEQLATPYRDGGWTVHQLVHHVADSHMNAYVRFKLALTEDEPVIKPYDEAVWANLTDTKVLPIQVSLDLLDALHTRWVALLRGMSDADFARAYFHPESKRAVPLREALGLYAWHGKHHT